MFKSLFDSGCRELKKCEKIAKKIDALAAEYKALSDDELKAKTPYFREQLKNGVALDDLIVPAFATVREAATRVLHMTPFLVQIEGALAMHGGNIAEMKTGEGKTLTATMVAYLNALPGEGVHIVTVNEYLANRDATEMGQLFTWLGLTVGLNIREKSIPEKKEAYACDITYSTNSELGFDYLRDHMAVTPGRMVQRALNFAIVDEVDSILIDEARTPLIISGGAKDTRSLYLQANTFVKRLEEADYEIDIKTKNCHLNESGMDKAEKFFNIENLYDVENVRILHYIENALKANYIMKKDVDYVVKDGAVIIVDPFTGRLMFGRQWTEGLHQAVEAKEGVEIKSESKTVATITFQNYFRMYKKLAGMTGTAKTEEEEFREIYNMYVVEVPTNAPVIRQDDPDLIFLTKKAKFDALADEIAERYKVGQPVLVGTIAIETSEYLSALLNKRHIPHNVLNAKQVEREAEIIAHAGEYKHVTIATNMAGRGTDIKLGEGVRELGGLAVLGSERHESRRIDNQLRGRSGRQGDPGYTRFFLSCEDDLLRRFGSERYETVLARLVVQDDGSEAPVEFKWFSNFVESAQKKVEGQNFDARKNIIEYDEVMHKQRSVIYEERSELLFEEDVTPIAEHMIEEGSISLSSKFVTNDKGDLDAEGTFKALDGFYFPKDTLTLDMLEGKDAQGVVDLVTEMTKAALARKREASDAFNKQVEELAQKTGKTPEEARKEIAQAFASRAEDEAEANAINSRMQYLLSPDFYQNNLKISMLRTIDNYWTEQIDAMDELKQSVRLQGYAQVNPLRMYQQIGYDKFNDMIAMIERDVIAWINKSRDDRPLKIQETQITGTSGGSSDSGKKKPMVSQKKPGRNDPCPCGSGRKYKDCHGKFVS